MIWKILFVIYSIIFGSICYLNLNELVQTEVVSLLDALANICVEIIIVLAFIYTFALGWKKQLISIRFNDYFLKFSYAAFALVSVLTFKNTYAPMYSDMLLRAMENGMVPRHFDFQMLLWMTRIEVLLFVLLLLFVVFVPFYLGHYHYTKHLTEMGVTKHSGRKCFAVYAIASNLLFFTVIFLGVSSNVVNYNIFDCLSILSGLYTTLGLYGYAFNERILTQNFWRITLPVSIVIELLPASLYSIDFKGAVGISTDLASPIYMLSSCIISAVAVFMLYRYAYTDVVFKKDVI